jgi:hypothetical protein
MLNDAFWHASLTLYHISLDFIRFLGSLFQSRSTLAGERCFRYQLLLGY